MLKTGVGMKAGADVQHMLQSAIESARLQLGEYTVSTALIFASSTFDQASVLREANAILGTNVRIIGASTAGEISQHGPSMSPSIAVMLIATDSIDIGTAFVDHADVDPLTKGQELAHKLTESIKSNPQFILMISDGLKVNPSAVLRGMAQILVDLPVVGGSAGDDGQYKQTFQYINETLLTSSVCAMAFGGNIKHAVGVRHGWNPISSFKQITKAEGTVIHEIDHKPAIALYEEYVGKEEAEKLKEITLAKLALSYPLGIKDKQSGEMLLRAPFYVDAQGSITCGGEITEGSEVQLMMGTKDDAVEAAKVSAQQALDTLGTEPKAVIVFSCHVRDTLFASREQSKKEIDAIQEVVGTHVPLIGFYTYAEQAPVQGSNLNIKSCNNVNHNETIVILLLGEAT